METNGKNLTQAWEMNDPILGNFEFLLFSGMIDPEKQESRLG